MHMANHLFITVRNRKNYSNSILVHSVGWLFHKIANTCQPVAFPNILSIAFFFSQHQSVYTLKLIVWYPNTLEQDFEAKVNLGRTSMHWTLFWGPTIEIFHSNKTYKLITSPFIKRYGLISWIGSVMEFFAHPGLQVLLFLSRSAYLP